MTQAQLADLIGAKDRSAVGHWERGKQPPNRDNLQAVAAALGVTIDWLQTGKTDTNWRGESYPAQNGGGERALRQITAPDPSTWPLTVPILRCAKVEPDGRFTVVDDCVIGFTRCPPMLAKCEDVYVVTCPDEKMSTDFEAGEPVWVDPRREVVAGAFVLVTVDLDNAPKMGIVVDPGFQGLAARLVYLVKLVKAYGKSARVAQQNPPREFDVDVRAIHHVMRPGLLLSGSAGAGKPNPE